MDVIQLLLFQSHQKDFELLSFWLSNMYQLLNCLKQYSGEEVQRRWINPLRLYYCFCVLCPVACFDIGLFCCLLTKGVHETKYTSPEKELLAELWFVWTQTDSQWSGHPHLPSLYQRHGKDTNSCYWYFKLSWFLTSTLVVSIITVNCVFHFLD